MIDCKSHELLWWRRRWRIHSLVRQIVSEVIKIKTLRSSLSEGNRKSFFENKKQWKSHTKNALFALQMVRSACWKRRVLISSTLNNPNSAFNWVTKLQKSRHSSSCRPRRRKLIWRLKSASFHTQFEISEPLSGTLFVRRFRKDVEGVCLWAE